MASPTMSPGGRSEMHDSGSASLIRKVSPGIELLDLRAQFATIRDQVMKAVEDVLDSQRFILGAEVQSLEEEIAQFLGARHAVACASGSDALLLALLALEIGPGHEVITTPFTFVATAGSIARTGAKPVFVDIDPDTYNIDPNLIDAKLTVKTRAIIPVHLFGLPTNMGTIMELADGEHLAVVEDAAQSMGARYRGQSTGTFGAFGCFSFFPSKNLGGAGDGGLITTEDAERADRLRLLRAHGSRTKYDYEILGMNSRLDALQAAILRVKLKHLDVWTAARQQRAQYYRELFAAARLDGSVRMSSIPAAQSHVYNQFVIRCQNRDGLRAFLKERGIPTEIYYPKPLHLQGAFAYLGGRQGQFPQAERAAREVLALPIYPELAPTQQATIVGAIREFYEAN